MRHGEDHPPPGAQHREGIPETRRHVGYVLKGHARRDEVEAALLPVPVQLSRTHHLVDDAQRIALLMSPRVANRLFREVDADHPCPPSGKLAAEKPLSTPEVEHVLSFDGELRGDNNLRPTRRRPPTLARPHSRPRERPYR